MPKKIAVFGGSFNPPGAHHAAIAEELVRRGFEVIVVPCGIRPDKETVGDIGSRDRAVMCDLAFGGIPGVTVDLFDLESLGEFTPTWRLEERYGHGEVWYFVGSDLIRDGRDGQAPIQTAWARGEELWKHSRFIVSARAGYPFSEDDLPPHSMVITPERCGSSSEIRERVFTRRPCGHLVTGPVRAYIERHSLYRGGQRIGPRPLELGDPRPLIVAGDTPRAKTVGAELLRRWGRPDEPNLILAVGGDGSMLHAVREHWRKRLPFFGVNAGTLGNLMHPAEESVTALGSDDTELTTRQLPLLRACVRRESDDPLEVYAFNDVWIERATGQAARLRVTVNGLAASDPLVADGLLVATPAGSTGYARAMGAEPRSLDAPELVVIASNATLPSPGWKEPRVPSGSEVHVADLGGAKRPLRAFADGVDLGPATGMTVTLSGAACAELAFLPGHDLERRRLSGGV